MDSVEYKETKSRKNYFKEIRKFKQLDSDTQIELALKAQKGDAKARRDLIECNQRFIVSIAKEYCSESFELEDLVNEGNIGMIRAIDKFDGTKKIRFLSYAVWWIRQSIISSIYENSETVRLPVNKINANNKVNKIRDSLTQELNREPTLQEMADKAGVEHSEAMYNSFDHSKSVSFESKINDDYDYCFTDFLEDDSHHKIENVLNKESLSLEIKNVFKQLSDRESSILNMYFGLETGEPMTLSEIGIEMSLTNERVRQIKETAKRKLRTHSKCIKLKEYLNVEFS